MVAPHRPTVKVKTPLSLVLLALLAGSSCRLDVDNPNDPNGGEYQRNQFLLQLLAAGVVQQAEIYLFSVSSPSNGILGGRNGADASCSSARGGITFLDNRCTRVRAFASFNTSDSIAAIPSSFGLNPIRPIRGRNGQTLANDFGDLLDGSIVNSLETTQTLPSSTNAWTFSTSAGAFDGTNNCGNGTQNTGSGVYGLSSSTSGAWIAGAATSCATTTLYTLCICF